MVKKNRLKINWHWLIYFVYGLVFVFATAFILSRFSIFGIRLFSVQSGSMEPTIKIGSLILTQAKENYQKGDIITFYNSSARKETTTHRIHQFVDKDGNLYFKTKGDANVQPDNNEISSEMVLGKTIFSVPYLGYPIAFVRTLPGLIILIIIPALLIIIQEGFEIKEQIKLWQLKKIKK